MKKILIFVDSYYPGYKGGGPITSIMNMIDVLEDDYDIMVCTSMYDHGSNQPYADLDANKILNRGKHRIKYLSRFSVFSIFKVIKEFQPDVLYCSSFLSFNSQRVLFLNKYFFKVKVILSPRGELLENAQNIKINKKRIFIYLARLFNFHKQVLFHATHYIEADGINKTFGSTANDISYISNITKIRKFKPLNKKKYELKLVFISRVSEKKNLDYAIDMLKGIDMDISFDIYGPIESVKYWNMCQDSINELSKNITVTYKGPLPREKVLDTMREYHALLFPTLSENYGHIIVEAMQSGLIVIISDQTPWVDLQEKGIGYSLSLHNKSDFITAINDLYLMDESVFHDMSLRSINFINQENKVDSLKDEYIKLFR